MGFHALVHEREHAGAERCPERSRFERTDVGPFESSQGLRREIVVAAGLRGGQPLSETGQREGVISHGADVVFGLPHAPALDARSRMQRVDDAPPEDVLRDRRRGDEEVADDRRRATRGHPLAVSPNTSRNRGPAGRNCAAGLIDRSNCSASGSRNTR